MRIWWLVAAVVAVLVVIVIFAFACQGPPSGIVVAKDFQPAHTITLFINNVPTTQFIPDTWYLRLDDGTDDGWREVDQATYQHVGLGDYYEEEK